MKYWLKSRAVWGGGAALLTSTLTCARFLATNVGDIVDALTALVGAMGALVAIYGRFKALQPLTFKNTMVGENMVNTAHNFTPEELDYLVANEVALDALRAFLGNTNADMSLDAAIGGFKNASAAEAEGKQVADPTPE